MTHTILRFEATPNPNALKCILDGPISDRVRSFRSAAEAQGDALARALFAVGGVTGLLFNGEWMTVNKAPDAGWAEVKRGVAAVLAGGHE